jgi:hypothetical protein
MSGCFDPIYFDPLAFDTSCASSSGGGRRYRRMPIIDLGQHDDELALLLLLEATP